MVRIIALATLLFGLNIAQAADDITPLDYVCTELGLDCTDIVQPNIVYTKIMGQMGWYGAYMPGENTIFVDPRAPAHTVVHEVTHYVLYNVGIDDYCTGEETARRVHHKWAGTEYSDEWKTGYGCSK